MADQILSIVMDDEKYFTFSNDEMPGNEGFFTDNIEKCPDDVRFKGKAKFPDKILVWIALSEDGMSEPLIRKQKAEAINGLLYHEECLIKRLVPFLEEYYPSSNYIFWPDKASPHYSKENIKWMDENLNYVSKDNNPPNVPQARPIETFWAILEQKVYANGWQAKTEQHLRKRIKEKLKEFDQPFFQRLFEGVRKKLRNIGENGVFSIFKK